MSECTLTPVAKSQCMIEAILDDLTKVHATDGGGGVTSIILDATDTYVVTISQEGRQTLYTYKVEVSDSGDVKILDRTTSTRSR